LPLSVQLAAQPTGRSTAPAARAMARRARPIVALSGSGRAAFVQAVTFPALTLVAATLGLAFPHALGALGSLAVFQYGLGALMLSMGVSLTPDDLRRALLSPREIALNALLCFGAAPLVAFGVSALLGLPPTTAAGLVLLGSVSGGQASNLCALLAGGDLALSVVLTTSSTLLGVLATPALVQLLLGAAVAVDGRAVLLSIAQLVLCPLTLGLAIAQRAPTLAARLRPGLPRFGIAALLLLVAGGSANAAQLILPKGAWRAHAASVLLALATGGVALTCARAARLGERAARTITIEAAIKSPTLAFVLARKHFSAAPATTACPAASFVWLAAIGAAAASVWSAIPVEDAQARSEVK